MGVKISCDVCGQFMADVNMKDLKNAHKKYGDKCADCVKMETDLKNFVESKRNLFNNKFGQLVVECREYMMGEIKGLLEERAKKVEMKLYNEEETKRKEIIDEYLKSQEPKKIEPKIIDDEKLEE